MSNYDAFFNIPPANEPYEEKKTYFFLYIRILYLLYLFLFMYLFIILHCIIIIMSHELYKKAK